MTTDNFNPPNSIWPNGLKRDEEGYVVFYPLGTNKIDISTITWPEGDKLVSPFVYQNDKLVGFVDTKALTVSGSATTTMNYNHIEADFASISEGKLTVNAPNATVKKFTWSVVDNGDDNVIVTLKYKGCETVDNVKAVDAYYKTTDIVDGVWSEGLGDLEDGTDMFESCSALTSFSSDLSSLTNGTNMFYSCSNLTSFTSDLSSLTNGDYMFNKCKKLASFSSDLPSLTDGTHMFAGCNNLTLITSDLSSLTNGTNMFSSCSNLVSISSDLSSLTDGTYMFFNCKNLTSITSDLSSLTIGDYMFNNCPELTSFSSDLSNLTNGTSMFYSCTSLTSFNADLPSLTNAKGMFQGCTSLTSFNADLPSLTNGQSMFYNCAFTSFDSNLSSLTIGTSMFSSCSSLTSFSSDLSSLTSGLSMFGSCKLDASSIKNIIDTINTYSGKKLTLGIGCNDTTDDKDLFAQEAGYADMTSLLAALQGKGWNVEAQYNGRPTTTYGLRRPSETTLPVFVKLEEVEEHADYTSVDGSKKYRLAWFHETTGSTEGYTQFNSLEEAVAHFNIKPIERN